MSAQRQRVLVLVAGEGRDLVEALERRRVGRDAEVLVVAPAVNSRLRHWASDVDGARRSADERARRCVERLRIAGLDAEGLVGDADPVQAVADALVLFEADMLVVDELLAGRSRDLAALPIVSGVTADASSLHAAA